MRGDIGITNAESALVILDVKGYVKECESQLNNTKNYKYLIQLIHNVIKSFENKNLIQKNIAEGLKINSQWHPRFYVQPKKHKVGNPGRPVISSLNCHTSKISEYVDYHLQWIARHIPSYVKDASDFISKLKAAETVPDNSYPVSLCKICKKTRQQIHAFL